MVVCQHTREAQRPAWLFLGGLILVIAGIALAPAGPPPPLPIQGSLRERAQLGSWYAPGEADAIANPKGYQESDFLYVNGLFYLFATGNQDPAWVDVYVGRTPAELVENPPAFRQVAPIRYPTVVKDGDTWHMWGVNPTTRWTEHWVSDEADPVRFVYSDSPFQRANTSPLTEHGRGSAFRVPVGSPVVDFAVRRQPGTGLWYGVGFETEENAPLLLTRAASPYGPWERLNYVPRSLKGGIFGDNGPPAWAAGARPDPNLAFTADGRAWVFFTGSPVSTPSPASQHRTGLVEVDLATGKAIGEATVLYEPAADELFGLVSDLCLVSVPGEPDRIFGYTHNPRYPLAELDVPTSGDE